MPVPLDLRLREDDKYPPNNGKSDHTQPPPNQVSFNKNKAYTFGFHAVRGLFMATGKTKEKPRVALVDTGRGTQQDNHSPELEQALETISSLKLKLNRLEYENRLLNLLLNNHPDYMSYLDRDLCFNFVNESYAKVLGLEDDNNFSYMPSIIGDKSYRKIEHNIKRALAGEALTFEVCLCLKNASNQDLRISYVPHWVEGEVQGIAARIENITIKKRAEQALKHQASHDLLTGLPNRKLFYDRLGKAIRKAQRTNMKLVVCFIDLDGFKAINDNYGHHAGDDILIRVARLIEASVRNYDTVARYGGDEFVLLLEDFDQQDIAQFAQALSARLSGMTVDFEHHDPSKNDKPLTVGVSLGFSIYSDHNANGELLVQQADEAMYAAKKSSHEYVVYDQQS